MARTKKAARRRRSAEEAREAILDAAERLLQRRGPGGIRLQDVAADVGVSHPAVLHHFGSRELLVGAVIDRAVGRLEADLIAELAKGDGPQAGADLLDRAARVLVDAGHGRFMAWVLLSGYQPLHAEGARTGWTRIAEATHAMRLARWTSKRPRAAQREAREPPTYEDTRFAILLSALTFLGEAVGGAAFFEAAGFGADPPARRRFRAWFAALVERTLEGG